MLTSDATKVAVRPLRRVILVSVSLVWGCLILLGTRAVMQYENAAAMPGEPASRWPANSRLPNSGDTFVLVMTAHPDCPCTRASVTQLEQLMARLRGKLAAFILFSKPQASEQDVRASELWTKAAKIPGVSVRYDRYAAESARFGGVVSGQVMLYDPEKRLVFAGGLTNARGQEGYSAGTDSVILRVGGNSTARAHTPVFGCSLKDPDAKELKEDSSWKKR